MAFRQPQQRSAPRHVSLTDVPEATADPSFRNRQPVDDKQEWVLFSPVQAPSTAQTKTTSTERTPRTAGLSRFSDFGSLDTAVKSELDELEAQRGIVSHAPGEEEGEELDSLDDGLHAFREPSTTSEAQRELDQSGGTVLPAHDGLGGFGTSSSPVQAQLWQFERYNPQRRHQRRPSSIAKRLEALEEASEQDHATRRRQRIENWRMEQSRALLDEIEKETRRRRRLSRAGARSRSAADLREESLASFGKTRDASKSVSPDRRPQPIESESFWKRFTRRVIRDLIGLDDEVLSVIFGEALPESAEADKTEASPMKRSNSDQSLSAYPGNTWELRLIERIAKELGILVHQLTEYPGAFTTYLRAHEPIEYAGLSVSSSGPSTQRPASIPVFAPQRTLASTSQPNFAPTLPQQIPITSATTNVSHWGIEQDDIPQPISASAPAHQEPSRLRDDREREYWERDLDIKTVFGFLRNRFSSRPASPHQDPGTSFAAATTNAQTSSRADIIRHNHPLVQRNSGNAAAAASTSVNQRDAAILRPRATSLKRQGSSCASQSTKRSRGSSRNYWDIGGGSVRSESVGFGAWAEV